MARSLYDGYPVTPERVAAAKAHNATERAKVFEQAGVRVTDDGVLVRPALHLIRCPVVGCLFVGSARTDDEAVRAIAGHMVGAHLRLVK